jgi:hypothetical protein
MPNTLNTPDHRIPCASETKEPNRADRLTELLETMRQSTSDIWCELRKCLAQERNLEYGRASQSHIRRQLLLDKAHELFRQAQSKVEVLVQHFGGRFHY